MARLFISYSSADKAFVLRLATDLRSRDHSVWLDEWEIKVGECIPTRIEAGLEASEYIVLVMSQRACSSPWVDREWKAKYWQEVTSQQVVILPALLEDCDIPGLLRTKRYADFRTDYEVGLLQLLATIEPTQRAKPAVGLPLRDSQHSPSSPGKAVLDLVRVSSPGVWGMADLAPIPWFHGSHDNSPVQVFVDQILVAVLRAGESKQVALEAGMHQVLAAADTFGLAGHPRAPEYEHLPLGLKSNIVTKQFAADKLYRLIVVFRQTRFDLGRGEIQLQENLPSAE